MKTLPRAIRGIPHRFLISRKELERFAGRGKLDRSVRTEFSVRQSARMLALILFAALVNSWSGPLQAQLQAVPGISLVAGNGTQCSHQTCGDNGPATSASIGQPWALTVDGSGNVYVGLGASDPRVRKIDANGNITTVAGTTTACSPTTGACGDGGPATSAQLAQPIGVAVDRQGNLYIADQNEVRIRKVTAATGVISNVAGTGATCSSTTAACGDGGPATSATFNEAEAVAIDSAGNLYIGDTFDNRVRIVSASTGIITTVVGTGSTCTSTSGGCGDGAAATQAAITWPRALAFDASGNLYIAEQRGQRVRKLTVSTGVISTVAGNGTACSSPTAACGDGGPATSANLNEVTGVAIDNAGNLYISDQNDNRVRKVSAATGVISTIVGTGASCTASQSACGNGAAAVAATMSSPSGIAVDAAGDLYLGAGNNYQVRKVSFGTFPSTAVQANSAVQNVLVTTTATETITSISVPASTGSKQEYTVGTMTGCTLGSSTSSGTTCTIPVTFAPAYPGLRPMPLQIVTSTGSISFPLTGFGTGPQTSLTPGTMTTIAGTGTACSTPTGGCGDTGSAVSANMSAPRGVFTDASGNVWVADTQDNRVRKFSPGGTVTTVAGTGAGCSGSTNACGDGSSATAAQLNGPRAVFVDPGGNLYIADTGDQRVRMVAAGTQLISTVAGTGTACSTSTGACGDGGLGTAAQLNMPSGLAMDMQGNLYIADSGDDRIRMLAAGYITTVAGTGSQCGSSTSTCGDGASALLASFSNPTGLFVDSASNLWVADTGDNRVREITWAYGAAPGQGLISTVAGTGNACGGGNQACGDGSVATSASLNAPRAIVVDAGGNLYVADTSDSRIRAVSASSLVISTVAGTGVAGSSGDNGSATVATLNAPRGISMDAIGNLIIADTASNRIRKVDVTASAFTFASTPYGTTSSDSPQTAVLSNIGNTPLILPIPSSGQNPSIATNFLLSSTASTACPAVTSTSSSPGSLPSGQSCTLPISFAPQQVGSISGSLVATDTALNVSGATQTIALTGTATADAPALTVVSSNNPSTYGSSLTFTATLGDGCTGSISFQDGSTSLGTATITGNSASWTTSSLGGGSHSIVASYAGSADCNSATSSALSQTVNKVAVTIAGSSSLNPSTYGDPIQLTFLFTGSASHATPTGSAVLYDGSNLLSNLLLDGSGRVSFTTSALTASSHSLRVVYNGDANYF